MAKTIEQILQKSVIPTWMILVLISFPISSCTDKDLYDPNFRGIPPLTGVDVPSGFDWKTISTVKLTVNANDEYDGKYYYIIEAYDRNPLINPEASLLCKGVAKNEESFKAEVTLPQGESTVYVQQTDPKGKKIVRILSVVSETIECDFKNAGINTQSETAQKSFSPYRSVTTTTPEEFPVFAPDDCKEEASGGNPGNYILTNYSGDINFWNGNVVLYIKGTVKPNSLYLGKNSKIIILDGGILTINSLAMEQGKDILVIQSRGKLKINGNLQIGRNKDKTEMIINKGEIDARQITMQEGTLLYNEGNITASIYLNKSAEFNNRGTFEGKSLSLNANVLFNNEGTVNIDGELTCTNPGAILNNIPEATINATSLNFQNGGAYNYGYINISGHSQLTQGGSNFFENRGSFTSATMYVSSNNRNFITGCKLEIYDKLELTDSKLVIDAGGLIKCKNLSMNNTRVEMRNKAMMNVTGKATFIYNSNENGFYGTGDEMALLKMKEAVHSNSYPFVQYGGNLQIECSKHPDESYDGGYNKSYNIEPSVDWVSEGESSIRIEPNACNEEGNNPSPGHPETDPDFPIIVPEGVSYTFLMEDNWPIYGDYDMNDLVMDIQLEYEMGKKSIKSLKIKTTLRAIGATYPIAAAIQLDKIKKTAVISVKDAKDTSPRTLTGEIFELDPNGTEKGEQNELAVIPLFDDAYQALGTNGRKMINTRHDGSQIEPKEFCIEMKLDPNANIQQEDISIHNLNFFIITGGDFNNRKEVHLAGYHPTSKANKNIFGNNDDNSLVTPYLSKDNLVWGLMIPNKKEKFSYPIELKNIRDAYPQFESWATSGGSVNTDWYISSNAILENLY